MSPRGTPGTAAASPPPLANPCRLLALPVRALAALSSAGARSRLTSGFGYNATHAASAQPEAGAAPGRWTGPLAGEAEPQSFRDVPPAFLRPDPHRIPISAGAPNRLSHSAPKHAKRGGGRRREREGRAPATRGMWPESRPRGTGWGKGSCSRRTVLAQAPPPGFAFRGAVSRTVPRLQLDAGAPPDPCKGKNLRGGWSGAFIRRGTTSFPPAPARPASGAE